MKKIIYLLIAASLIISFSNCKKNKNKGGDTTDTLSKQFEEYFTDESDTVVAVADTTTKIMTEDSTGKLKNAEPQDLSKPNKKFYIIVGSYKKIENAQKRVDYFKKLGYKCEIVSPSGIYNRVAIASFDDEKIARQELKKYRQKFNDHSYWLLLK